jgi:hypothetical protein
MKATLPQLFFGLIALVVLYFIYISFITKKGLEGFTSHPLPNEIGKPCTRNADCREEYGIFCVNGICQST